jgi:hypothetical protein
MEIFGGFMVSVFINILAVIFLGCSIITGKVDLQWQVLMYGIAVVNAFLAGITVGREL